MRKLITIIGAFVLGFGLCGCSKIKETPKLEVRPNTTQVVLLEEEVETETETEVVETEEELTEEKFIEQAKEYLSQYMEESMVVKIITWAIDAGILSALFAISLKYRKYKHTTTEDLIKGFKTDVETKLKESFDKMSVEEIKKVVDKVDDLEASLETIMKVLVLAQDTSTKGRATLIDFLGSKTDSREVREATREVKKTLIEEETKAKEINDKVSTEYQEIF